MGYYPIVVQLAERPCLVIGGGLVAERKVDALLAVGADITVVSPECSPRLAALARERRIRVRSRGYLPGDLAGFALALAATRERGLNAAVAAEGRRLGVWVNVADDPERCDFILPSVLRRGHLTVAVSTGGASPALARVIREELEAYFGDDYRLLADVASEVRREMRQAGRAASASAWRRALDPSLRRLIARGRSVAAKARLVRRLREPACL